MLKISLQNASSSVSVRYQKRFSQFVCLLLIRAERRNDAKWTIMATCLCTCARLSTLCKCIRAYVHTWIVAVYCSRVHDSMLYIHIYQASLNRETRLVRRDPVSTATFQNRQFFNFYVESKITKSGSMSKCEVSSFFSFSFSFCRPKSVPPQMWANNLDTSSDSEVWFAY